MKDANVTKVETRNTILYVAKKIAMKDANQVRPNIT